MIRIAALLVVVTLPLAAQQNAQEVLLRSQQMQAAREAGVQNYTLIQGVQGMETPSYFEKEVIGGRALFRLVPISEWQERRGVVPGGTKENAAAMADGYDLLGGAIGSELRSEPGGAVFAQLITGMLDTMSLFLRSAEDSVQSDGRAEAAGAASGMAQFAQRARLIGRDTVDGKRAFHVMANDLSGIALEQPSGGGTFAVSEVHMWFDATEFVPVRLTINGSLTANRTTTPLVIEMYQLDYQRAGSLYLPGRQVMRISGLMEAMATDPKQRRELEKSRREAAKMQAQMADMDEQLAAMPAGTRRMVEGRIQKAMAQLDQLLAGGVMEAEVTSRVRGVNEGPPYDWIPGKQDLE
jgi:hypothetical protein